MLIEYVFYLLGPRFNSCAILCLEHWRVWMIGPNLENVFPSVIPNYLPNKNTKYVLVTAREMSLPSIAKQQ